MMKIPAYLNASGLTRLAMRHEIEALQLESIIDAAKGRSVNANGAVELAEMVGRAAACNAIAAQYRRAAEAMEQNNGN